MNHLLERLLDHRDLTADEAASVLEALAAGAVPQALAGALLAALRAKGETGEEVRGFARAMRALASRPRLGPFDGAIDVVGTGGDLAHSVNLSTGAALLVAACGVPVVKHGNRAISGRCGSADVLEALGLPLPLDAGAASACLAETSFTFLFAPHYHPAMEALAPVRRALGVRTVFNLLGPLTNPAEPPYALIGAWSLPIAALMAEALAGLGLARAFVVHGAPGWDEPTPCGPFTVFDVRAGRVSVSRRDPLDAGLPRCAPEALAGGSPVDNAARLRRALSGESGAHRDALTLGAGLALEISGRAARLEDGMAAAAAAIDDGRAGALVERLAAFGARLGRTR